MGTELGAGNSASISAVDDVNFEVAESTRSSINSSIGMGFGTETENTQYQAGDDEADAGEGTQESGDAGNGTEEEGGSGQTATSTEISGEFELGLSNSTQQHAATITSGDGGIQINSGGDTNLVGTQMETTGSAELNAGGSINESDAVNSSSEFGLGFEASFTRETEEGDLGPAPGGDEDPDSSSRNAEDEEDLGLADLFAEPEETSPANEAAEPSAEAEEEDLGLADLFAEPEDEGETPETTPAEEEGGPENEVGGGLTDLTIENEEETQSVSIEAEGGVTRREGVVPPQPISGVSMTLKSTKQADGSLKTLVPVPRSLPEGTEVAALLPDGSPLPEWVEFDPETGTVSGTPPEGSPGVNLVVSIPNADGSVRKIGVQFGTGN